ncbi:MAG: hypothetical protein ACMUJI_15140 [Erythrobacter sp.]|uniref:hypothetical protein n=1 Tax=Erythrobacter sp. TaxID=1042 RepID=UPI003A879E68
MRLHHATRMAATALLAGLSMVLSGCFITPGKFTSELILTEPDQFTFTYEGEIFFVGLSQLAEMGNTPETFEPKPCFNDNTFEERECSRNEIAGQRAEWEAGAEARAAEAARKSEQMAALMAGIDPANPEATAELTRLLLRQEGWEKVEAKGDGLFDIRYSVTGELNHDFMFPVIEDFPTTNPFVQVILRKGDVVRINAPGFAAENDANPMAAMMGGMAGLAGLSAISDEGENGPKMPEFPTVEGTFTIVTSGRIMANNTDEGASRSPNGEVLTWAISPRTKTAPTALLDLSR